MKSRIAVLALGLAFLAAPAAAALADACPPCCPRVADEPCHSDPGAALDEAPCCNAAPATPATETKRTADAPTFQPAAPAARAPAPEPRCTLAPPARGDLAVLVSPLRLSVVLLI